MCIRDRPSEGCEPLLVTFIFDINNTLIDQNSLHYNFGDPNSSSNISTDATTSHLYNESGFYIVTLTANSVYGCPVSYTDTVRVYKTPIADFITHPDAPDMNNPLINFYDQSYLASTWNWTFGDLSSNGNNYSDNQNPTHTYPDTGNYQITLIVSNSNSCYDTVIHIIRILPTFEFWIPNAFTPGGDGRNETFYGKGLGFKNDNFEMFVYDRWGKLIFSKTGYDEFGWDGTFMNSGKICEQGGYTYLIKLTEIGGLNHVYKGITFLIR